MRLSEREHGLIKEQVSLGLLCARHKVFSELGILHEVIRDAERIGMQF